MTSIRMNPGVEKVEIEAPNGNEILTTVHINSVDSEETGIAIATRLHIAAMDRICFFHTVAIENGHVIESNFSPVNLPPGSAIGRAFGLAAVGGASMKSTLRLSGSSLKHELEQREVQGRA